MSMKQQSIGCLLWFLLFVAITMVEATPPGIAKNPSHATCKIKKYKLCYNLVHVCPKFCPDQCTVECASCKPICSGSSIPTPSTPTPIPTPSTPHPHPTPTPSTPFTPTPSTKPPTPTPSIPSTPTPSTPYPHPTPTPSTPYPHPTPTPTTPTPTPTPSTPYPHPTPSTPSSPAQSPTPSTSTPSNASTPTPSTPYPHPSPTPSTPSTPTPSSTPSTSTPSTPTTPTPSTPHSPNPNSTTSTPSPTPSASALPTTATPSSPSPSSSPSSSSLPTTTSSSPSPSTPSSPSPSSSPSSSSLPTTTSSSPSPSTPSSPHPSPPKTSKCKNKKFPECYNMEHVCPNSCPGGCVVDCVTCKPICNCDKPGAVCQDPRFIGGDGITFYFHGKKDEDFCLVSDSNLHINAHFIGKRNQNMKRDFTWVQSIAILFGKHKLFLGALNTSTWDESVDRLSITFNGAPITLSQSEGEKWGPANGEPISVSRIGDTNNVEVEVDGLFKITAKVVPITEEDSRIHNYGVTKEDCLAHLDLGFKFYSLSNEVNGVLGQTYGGGYVSRVKIGAIMPVMGGDEEFRVSNVFASDCAVARFDGGGGVGGGDWDSSGVDFPGLRCGSGVDGRGVVCKR